MVAVTTELSSRRIADLFVTFVESGLSRFWCDSFELASPGDVAPDDQHKGPWYDNPRRYEDPDLRLKVVVSDDDDSSTDHFIGLKEIEAGLKVMAEKYPRHLADIVNENDDANTADLFVQCAVFGEEVYA